MADIATWESQLRARANEMLARRAEALSAEIERLQKAVSEIGSRLAEQRSHISGDESSGLIEEVRRWFDDQAAKLEEDFKARLEEAANARREAEAQIKELREQLEASRKALATYEASPPQLASQAALFEKFTAASEEIVSQRTQSEILAALVRRAAEFAPRVVFFVIKSGDAVGWKASGFKNGLNDETVRLLTVPSQKRTLLRDAITSSSLAAAEPRSSVDGVSDVLGLYGSPAPERAIAVPLTVLNKVVAVLYADSGAQSEDSLNVAAAESLTRIAGRTIEFLLARRGAEPARPIAQAAAAAADLSSAAPARTDHKSFDAPRSEKIVTDPPDEAATERRRESDESGAFPETPAAPDEVTIERRLTHEPPAAFDKAARIDEGLRQAEAQLPEPGRVETEPVASLDPSGRLREGVEKAVSVSGRLRFEALTAQRDGERQTADAEIAPPASPTPAPDSAISLVEEAKSPLDATPLPAPPPAPVLSSPSKPLKPAQPAATLQGSEAEQRAHNDARRFARLLVSEIKLYNAAKVNDGRRNCDLYDRLKDEIDRNRKVYDKRVSPAVAARFDYFYDELVQTLAEGDPAKLGANCPGPVALA